MTKWNFIFLTIFLTILIELLLGSFGVIFPLSAILVFYITVTYNWHYGLFFACICGILIDLQFGRSFIITPFSLGAVTFIALFWYHQVESQSLILHFIPGGFLAILYLFPLMLIQIYSCNFSLWVIWNNIANLTFCVLACSIMLPMIILILDGLSSDLDLEQYCNAKNKDSGR